MADETPPVPIGTSALRRSVAAARAGAGAASRIAPAPPPDQTEVPWAAHREPRPQTLDDERKAAAVAGVTAPVVPRKTIEKMRKSQIDKKSDVGFDLVNAILTKWTKDVKDHNIGYANSRMAQQLIRNGAILIQQEYHIDQLAALIRLGNELVKNTIDEGDEDKRIDDIRKLALARADMSSTTPENANAGEEAPPDGEDEDNGE